MNPKASNPSDRALVERLSFVTEWSARITVLIVVVAIFPAAARLPIGRTLFLISLVGVAWISFLCGLTKLLRRWKWPSEFAWEDDSKQSGAEDSFVEDGFVVEPNPLPPIIDPPRPAPLLATSSGLAGDTDVIAVPAEIVARSRPAGRSVPLVAKRRQRERPHPFRNLAMALLMALVPLIALILAGYYFDNAELSAGYHLDCSVTGQGKYAHTNCDWKK
jgi:hypothetical protein